MKVIFPPRPQGKMSPTDLGRYEASGKWVAQRKFNESRNLLHVEPGLVLSVWSRHGDEHKRFVLTTSLRQELLDVLNLDPKLEYWIDGGVMNKTKDAGSEMVFFDLLQAGRYFFARPTQMERLSLLADICRNPVELTANGLALKVSDRIWLAQTFEDEFTARFEESLKTDMVEGLVLRKRESTLDNFGKAYYEVDWMIRCRKPNNMYNL